MPTPGLAPPRADRGPMPPPTARPPKPAPEIPPGTPIVHLRSVSYGTFLYEKMIGSVEGGPSPGDVVAVVDKRNDFFGWAFYNPRSKIVLRMISHEGPYPDDALLAQRVRSAVLLRRGMLALDGVTDAYRLIHAEGDGLSGLIADRFGPYVVLEIFSLAMHRRLALIEDALIDAGLSVKAFLHRMDRKVAQLEGVGATRRKEPHLEDLAITEHGMRFHVDLRGGHKTGFFCDQRDNRLALTALTPQKRVLDVCCYTGGFAVYAAAKGAAGETTGVDLDEKALEVASANAKLNDVPVRFRHADAFNYLRDTAAAKQQWDVVVVDPSKFVPTRATMDLGLRKYADLNRLAAGVVAPGGVMVTCSCSGLVDVPTFTQTVARAVRAAGRTYQIFRVSGASPDHPFHADTPEGQYLKVLWGRVL